MLRPGYFLRRAASSLRENPFINLVTVGTIAVAMVLFGGFLLLVVNLQGVIDRLGGNVEISAYLRDGATPEQVSALGDRLRHVPEVSEVKLVSKADALAVFKRVNPEDVPLLGLVDGNPFPASYQVKLSPGHRDGETVKRLADDLMGDP